MSRLINTFFHITLAAVCLAALCMPQTASASQIETIAIAPFESHSLEDISHVEAGMARMLYARLSWKDRVKVLLPKSLPAGGFQNPEGMDERAVRALAQKINTDYVITGTVTHFAGAFSLDILVHDLAARKTVPFFAQADNAGDVILELNNVAARINKDIFNRTTLAYKQMEQTQNSHEQELLRMNPEQMMPYITPSDPEGADEPLWKFWKWF